MADYLAILFQFLPASLAYAFLGFFAIIVIVFAVRLVKIILDALPFV